MQLTILCLTPLLVTVVLAAAYVFVECRAPSGRRAPRRVGYRVTVHTKRPDDRTYFGVVSAEYSDRLVLEDAELVTPDGTHPLPGRQDVPTREISWVDVHALVADTRAPVALPAPAEAEVVE